MASPGVELFVAKVINDFGTGPLSAFMAGAQWAIERGCSILCVAIQEPAAALGFSIDADRVRRAVLQRGGLILASAGNESNRPALVAPVAQPANCPSIAACGALQPDLNVWPLSNGGRVPGGGEVDIAAPGFSIHSAWTQPTGYRREHGTSMAAAVVSGVAALHPEADPNARRALLLRRLQQTARRLALIQAP